MSDQSQPGKDGSSRKKFLLWGAALLGSLGLLKYINRKPAEEKKTTVKMLSQDGTLVEVDITKINRGASKKVTDEELKKWVTKK
jgi:hypothetical protein